MTETRMTDQGGAARLTRRVFIAGLPLALAACQAGAGGGPSSKLRPAEDPHYLSMYGPNRKEPFPLPAINLESFDRRYLRRKVDYSTKEKPGTIIIDTSGPHLFLVEDNGKAMRYGVGVGRQGFEWSGRARIGAKRTWPRWHPPEEMIQRQPELAKYRNGGKEPGLGNPLGARALYLYEGNKDTLYRIHGTNEPWSIGKRMSSGCIRMLNQDVIDLYERTAMNAPVVVTHGTGFRLV